MNHPSKEASTRCRSCGKWLCDRCQRRFGARVYCGGWCRIVGQTSSLARRTVSPAWSIAVAASASALLLTAIGVHMAELFEIRSANVRQPATAEDEPTMLSARLIDDGDRLHLQIEGNPGSRVVVVGGGRVPEVITLGDDGRATSRELERPPEAAALEVAAVGRRITKVQIPAAVATPTVAPATRPTGTATPAAPAAIDEPRRADARPAVSPPVLQLVNDAGPRIAITFDGNASSNRTAELLDLLQELDLQVTLFVTGRFIERHPAVVRRAVLAGHEVGNHTYSHPHLTTYARNRRHRTMPGMTRLKLQRELERTEQAFRAATGRGLQPLWRAPYGEENRALRGWALEAGYLHVRWSSLRGASLDTRDWVADEHSALYQSSQTIMEKLLAFPKLEGGIILMHLATEREDAPWAKLPEFVRAIRERGVRPAQVTDLLEASPTWRQWLEKARANHRQANGA